MKISVSVIVTVHNSAKYLRRCLDSVIHQSLKDIEVLCIDGGSKDASPEILKEYAEIDSRIKIINDRNTSYGHKINKGIDLSQGRYFSIIETDDYYQHDMLQSLTEIADNTGADYVDGNYQSAMYVRNRIIYYQKNKYPAEGYERILDNEENCNFLAEINGVAIWTGIYRLSFVRNNNIRMAETPGASYQDTSFGFLVTALAEKSYHLNKNVYVYNIDNENSSVYDQTKMMAIIRECNYLYSELEKRNVCDSILTRYYFTKYSCYYWNSKRIGYPNAKEFIDEYYKELFDDDSTGRITRTTMNPKYSYTYALLDNRRQFEENLGKTFSEIIADAKSSLNEFIEKTEDKDIIIFGNGKKGQRLYNFLKNNNMAHKVKAYCDNNTNQVNENHISIISPEKAVNDFEDCIIVIPDGKYAEEMAKQLKVMKLTDRRLVMEKFSDC